jgi:CRP/FNR family transcriptional regulator, cyclic AMP receptor protein
MRESDCSGDKLLNIEKVFKIPSFEALKGDTVSNLMKISKIREYDDGELIIREGDDDNWLYFLLGGKIKVTKNGVKLASCDTIGDVFGEIAMIDGSKRSASVSAEGETTCLAINTDEIQTISSKNCFAFGFILYRMFSLALTKHLRKTNQKLIDAQCEIDRLNQGGMQFQGRESTVSSAGFSQ